MSSLISDLKTPISLLLRLFKAMLLGASLAILTISGALAQEPEQEPELTGLGPDTTPPVIELEELVEGVADLSQVFAVQIAENGELQDATLYYRRQGQQAFTPVAMEPLGNSGLYSVTVKTDPEDLRPIEYYIQARDASGNRSVSGYAFEPYVRRLSPADPVAERAQVETTTQPVVTESDSLLNQRWVQVALGVVAVGVTLALINGDDGEDVTRMPVTINLP